MLNINNLVLILVFYHRFTFIIFEYVLNNLYFLIRNKHYAWRTASTSHATCENQHDTLPRGFFTKVTKSELNH